MPTVTLADPGDGPNGDDQWPSIRRGLTRRHDAAVRLAPLECGCADPQTCRCGDDRKPSEVVADAAVEAFLLLESRGLPPMVSREDKAVLRRLWWRNGPERKVAERVAKRCGMERG